MDHKLRLYDVIDGNRKTQMWLNEADAAARGDAATLAGPAGLPPPTVKPAPAPADATGKNRLVTSNKMRGTAE